uniref:Cwf19-like C-terminal domain-containing protein n=1 Tax=Compsopogon caeruleus TaxID=31354 RepID=A0A7S1XEQ2_9RHOD
MRSEEELVMEQKREDGRKRRRERLESDGLDSCRWCYANLQRFKVKHLVVALGETWYLSLPHTVEKVQGQCYLAPIDHESAAAIAEGGPLQKEITKWKDNLARFFFEKEKKEVLFTETALLRHSMPHHLRIECFPLQRRDAEVAPSFFRQAILDTANEWSENPRLVEYLTESGKPVPIVQKFSYFSVEFGRAGGFIHIIENEGRFDLQFGQSVIASILSLSPPSQRPQRHRPEIEFQLMKNFAGRFEPYNWTRELVEP